MQIAQFPRHIFWQYKPDADLPDLVVLENLLLYGDLDELFEPQRNGNKGRNIRLFIEELKKLRTR